MTPLVFVLVGWLLAFVGFGWLILTHSPVQYDPQLPPTWRPHPRTIVHTHHLTGGRND